MFAFLMFFFDVLFYIQEHPWVTRHGQDTLQSYEENTTDMLIPTEEKLNKAITKSISHVMTIVRAWTILHSTLS